MGGLCRLVSGIACSLGTVLSGQTVFPQRLFCTSAIRARR